MSYKPLQFTVGLMSAQWKSDHSIRKWKLPRPCEIFRKKYECSGANTPDIVHG